MGAGVGVAVGAVVGVGVGAGVGVGVGVGLEHPSNTASTKTATQDNNFGMENVTTLEMGGLWSEEGGGLALIVCQGPRDKPVERERDSSGRSRVDGRQRAGAP